MGRPRKKKIEEKEIKQDDIKKTLEVEQDKYLTMYECAQYFRTTESTIKLWVQHGHLIKTSGTDLIPMRSILRCRFNVRG